MCGYPRVLVISHNVFSESGNMGRTMADMLSAVPAECLAQLYFHTEIPTLKMCKRYFRITDKDILKSVLSRKPRYHIYNEEDICENAETSRTDSGMTAKAYQYARRRTPFIYSMRNLMWQVGRWDSSALEEWICAFEPEVIFFASGDYSFAYKIVYKIAKRHQIPVVMWCCDDHYISKKTGASFSYKRVKKNLLTWAKRVAGISKNMVVISDKMKKDYRQLFETNIEVLRISASKNSDQKMESERRGIVYAGNLGVNRMIPLLELGNVLRQAGISGYSHIDVYSGERDPKKLEQLTGENGVCFHGSVTQQELSKVLGRARYVLHVEAFDEDAKRRTRYSLSTKIGESLQSGACIIAYGPADISSMEYLQEHGAAVVLKEPDELPQVIEKYNEGSEFRIVVERQEKLAQQCHDKKKNDEKILKILQMEKVEVTEVI